MKDISVQKRRFGEFILYEEGLYLKFEPVVNKSKDFKKLDKLYNPKPAEDNKTAGK